MKELSALELEELLASGKEVKVIDVREEFERDAGHIPNDISCPMSLFELNKLPKAETLVFYCAKGKRSLNVASYVKQHLPNVKIYNLIGGFEAWVAAGCK